MRWSLTFSRVPSCWRRCPHSCAHALALERRSSDEILEMAIVQGMRRLKADGLETVKQGRTSIAEIARVVTASAAVD